MQDRGRRRRNQWVRVRGITVAVGEERRRREGEENQWVQVRGITVAAGEERRRSKPVGPRPGQEEE